MSKTLVGVPFMKSSSFRFQLQGAQKKASDTGHPLGRGRTAVYNGLYVMAYILPTARTGAEAYPDDPGTSQVSENLQQLSPKPVISLTWNIKNKTKTNSEIQRTDCWLPEGKGIKCMVMAGY